MKTPALFHVKQLLLALLFPLCGWAQHASTSTIELRPMPKLPSRNAAVEQYLQTFPLYNQSSEQTREWYYWTNYSRSSPRHFYDSVVVPVLTTYPNLKSSYSNSLRNDLYATRPLPMLRPSSVLTGLAQSHADDLKEARASISHTSPSGATFQARMKGANIKCCAGENLSFGPLNTILALVFLYIDQDIPDLGHRKALLNGDYSQMGIGISAYRSGSYMVVQDVSCNQ